MMEATKQRRIVTRQDDYHKRMYRSMMISPARVDPFADSKPICVYVCACVCVCLCVRLCVRVHTYMYTTFCV